MAEKKTETGKKIDNYIRETLADASAAGKAALAAGYPADSSYTEAYYMGVPYLYEYGDAQQAEALARSGQLFDAYGQAGGYNKTGFGDIEGRYSDAGRYDAMQYGDLASEYGGIGAYDPTSFRDFEARYGEAGQYNPMEYGDLESGYGDIAAYDPTQYGDIEAGYRAALGYDPREYEDADYTTQNIRNRMNPYEELVSDRARARLKKSYDEARGEREAQAARSGAFGGSGAAIQEEVARRNYLEQMADMDAQNLQNAYEAGVGLYGKELSDRLAAGQAEEASRQFGQQAEMAGLEGLMAARNAQEQALEFQKKLQLDVMSGKITARQAEEASRQYGQQAEFAGLEGAMGARTAEEQALEFQKKLQLDVLSGKITARQAEEASRQFGKQAEFSGLEGMMGAREQTAAQEAAAKEAEFAGLAGQSASVGQQAALAEQQKNMQIANLAAMQQAGQQKQDTQLAKQEYGLNIAGQQANLLAPLAGSAIQTQTKNPSTAQNILGGITAGIGAIQGIGGLFRDGGIVYSHGGQVYKSGGLADLYHKYHARYK